MKDINIEKDAGFNKSFDNYLKNTHACLMGNKYKIISMISYSFNKVLSKPNVFIINFTSNNPSNFLNLQQDKCFVLEWDCKNRKTNRCVSKPHLVRTPSFYHFLELSANEILMQVDKENDFIHYLDNEEAQSIILQSNLLLYVSYFEGSHHQVILKM